MSVIESGGRDGRAGRLRGRGISVAGRQKLVCKGMNEGRRGAIVPTCQTPYLRVGFFLAFAGLC